MHIALDAMGGDYAPGPIVAGAVQAISQDGDLRVTLVGDEAQIQPLLDQFGRSDRLGVFHCSPCAAAAEHCCCCLRKAKMIVNIITGALASLSFFLQGVFILGIIFGILLIILAAA